jgi:hypothetical protein
MAKVKTKGWAVTFNANTAKEETINIPIGGPVRALKKARKKVRRRGREKSKIITLVRLSAK